MRVFLAEKREVALAIAKCINPNYQSKNGHFDCGNNQIVTWCLGHLLKLTDPEDHDERYKDWDLDLLPMQWPVSYKISPSTAKQFKVVKQLLLSANQICVSTDIDSSGQAIANEILEFLNISNNGVERCLINDNNPKSILKALQPSAIKLNSDFTNLYYQEKARAVGDQRLGYIITRALSCQSAKQGLKRTWHTGRVQTAILGLTARRFLQKTNHTKQIYYNVDGEFQTAGGVLKGRLITTDLNLYHRDDKERLNNERQVIDLIESLKGAKATLEFVETKEVQDSPPLPYDLISLQADCSRIFGLDPDDVYNITQKLREGPFFAITYNRSDCRYISEENYPDAPEIIEKLSQIGLLNTLAGQCNPTIKSRAFNTKNVGAHGAIIPTDSFSGFEDMNEAMQVVFTLIARNYLIQFLDKRIREVTSYTFSVPDGKGATYTFQGRTQKVLRAGWSEIFQNDDSNEETALDDVDCIDTSSLVTGQHYSSSVVATQRETKPLPLYTMSTLLMDIKNTAKYIIDPKIKAWMLEKDKDNKGENGSIGTAATRTGIIKGLFKSGLIQKDSKGKITPTEDGLALYSIIPESISSPQTTAVWSHYFKLIGEGEITMEQFWREVDNFIDSEVHRIKTEGLKIPEKLLVQNHQASGNIGQSSMSDKCPKCKHPAKLINGKFGPYWQCSNKEGCDSKFDNLGGKLFFKSCPKCHKPLRITTPKKRGAKFISCTGYPTCQHTMQIADL